MPEVLPVQQHIVEPDSPRPCRIRKTNLSPLTATLKTPRGVDSFHESPLGQVGLGLSREVPGEPRAPELECRDVGFGCTFRFGCWMFRFGIQGRGYGTVLQVYLMSNGCFVGYRGCVLGPLVLCETCCWSIGIPSDSPPCQERLYPSKIKHAELNSGDAHSDPLVTLLGSSASMRALRSKILNSSFQCLLVALCNPLKHNTPPGSVRSARSR